MAGPRRQRSALRSAFPAILLLPGLVSVLAGADGFVVSSDPPPLINAPGILVLTSGRTLAGRITQNAAGFVVDQQHGTIAVPFEMAEFPARDLQDAIRLYHERTPNPTAGFHFGLAQWCVQHQLFDEARSELKSALILDPYREDARHMLQRLDTLLDPPEPAVEQPAPMHQVGGFDVPEISSLAGLDPEHARFFTERVQPILMNKCGNATCHGPAAENEFRLTRVRLTGGAHRVHSERNLAVTLKYVDRRSPDRSPLLLAPQGNHGRAGRTIFGGPFGDEQFETLREWVRGIARTGDSLMSRSTPDESTPALEPLTADDDRDPSRSDNIAAPDAARASVANEAAFATAPRTPPRSPVAPADAFDPEPFNRAVETGNSAAARLELPGIDP